SFSHSSLFSDTTAENAVLNINERLIFSRQFFKQAKVLMITFGTAWVFEDTETGKVVSNCHKLPANRFSRYRLDVKQIVDEYIPLFISLKAINPELKIILTISPIRHWKDGVHENTLSKSTLHLAVDTLEKELPDVHYFPAYEIMMDELRDYRFYASDMLHPSDVAVDYIWQRFSETYFSANTRNLKIELEQLRADLNHRSLHPETKEYQQFIQNMEKRKSGLISMYPFLEKRMNK
ncbi:MAG: hypothetical protein H6Q18_821, partial [Bacteroidetes bacterium]|nr:hypothetical protein [Bacteroidota bacterium]